MGNKTKVMLLAIGMIMGVVALCVLGVAALTGYQLFPSDREKHEYISGKQVIGIRERVLSYQMEPGFLGIGKSKIPHVATKIWFVDSGARFPEDGSSHELPLIQSPNCGYAVGVADVFYVVDADPGGLLRWSYRGYNNVGEKNCLFGEPVNYPHFSDSLNPDSIPEKLGLWQDCWLSVFGPTGISKKTRCSQSHYSGIRNLKAVSATADSMETYFLIVISDDGISAVPLTFVQQIMGSSGIQFNLESLMTIINQINSDADNPAYTPIWQFWKK